MLFGPKLAGASPLILRERYLEAAAKAEGVVDFGPLDFIEPFEIMLHDLVQHAKLSPLGQLIAPYYLMQILRMRLKVQNSVPLANSAPVQQPIFILGLPRTGSTILHELLNLHEGLRAPTFWESHHWPRQNWRDIATQNLTRAQLAVVDLLAPTFRRIHHLGALKPHECVSIQGYSLRSMQFHVAFRLPTYDRWMTQAFDWTPAYAWHARHLGAMPQTNQRWLLKAPGHMLGIKALIAQYPDALFVQTHRDPAEVIPSMASLTQSLRGMASNHNDLQEIGHDVNRLWHHGITSLMQERALDPTLNARFLDIDYRRFLQQPSATLKSIAAFTGIDWSEEYANATSRYLIENPGNKHGKHNYNLQQFGLDPVVISEMYDDYKHLYVAKDP